MIFRNDIRRTDNQVGIFGELGIDLSDQFSLTLGVRNYEIEVDLGGQRQFIVLQFWSDRADAQAFGTNISRQFAPDSTVPGAPDKAVADGTIFKATLDWRPTDEHLYYVTLSEGFRPGLLNRPGGADSKDGSGFVVPFELDTDEVVNLEVGMKADFGNAFRLNAALFNVDIERLQTTIFDTSIVNLFFSDNAADAKVTGLEADFTWLPDWSDGLTVAGAVSFLNSEITRKITPTNDVRVGDELAFAPSSQGNLRARYEWDVGGWTAHVMPMISWSADSYSDIITINRDLVQGWTMLGLTAGVANDDWSVTFFANNLTDERAEVSRSFVFDTYHVTYAPAQDVRRTRERELLTDPAAATGTGTASSPEDAVAASGRTGRPESRDDPEPREQDNPTLASIQARIVAKQYEQALADLNAILRDEPDNTNALYMSAVCRRYRGEFGAALKRSPS